MNVARSVSIICAMSAGCRWRPLQHDFRADHDGGVRNAPAVGVKHGDQLQDRVALTQSEANPP